MTLNIVLLAGIVVLGACGVYLLLERSVTRVILGTLLLGNMANLVIFTISGEFGRAPIVEKGLEPETASDPLPQAFILTAIVISFATCAFMLALLYRAWRLARAEAIHDDEEDRALRHIDPEEDDETFTETDPGDTEFGAWAESPVAGVGPAFRADDDLTQVSGPAVGGATADGRAAEGPVPDGTGADGSAEGGSR